jgi:hypothetical protein
MRYESLINGVRKFHEKFGKTKGERKVYPKSIAPSYINWDNIQDTDVKRIFSFLNRWGQCRLKCSHENFIEGYKKVAYLLKPFRRMKLEYFTDFDQLLDIQNERIDVKKVIHCAFDGLMNIRGFGPVSTSKTLHLVAPGFFVMWDKEICQSYCLRLNGYYYANHFMPKMREELEEAINDLMKNRRLDREGAIQHIYRETQRIHGMNKTLAKSIDEFCWVTAHLNRL